MGVCFEVIFISLIKFVSVWNEDHTQEYPVTENVFMGLHRQCELLQRSTEK